MQAKRIFLVVIIVLGWNSTNANAAPLTPIREHLHRVRDYVTRIITRAKLERKDSKLQDSSSESKNADSDSNGQVGEASGKSMAAESEGASTGLISNEAKEGVGDANAGHQADGSVASVESKPKFKPKETEVPSGVGLDVDPNKLELGKLIDGTNILSKKPITGSDGYSKIVMLFNGKMHSGDIILRKEGKRLNGYIIVNASRMDSLAWECEVVDLTKTLHFENIDPIKKTAILAFARNMN